MKPFASRPGTHIHAVEDGTGMVWTQFRNYIKTHPQSTFLVISRISSSHSLLGVLGFNHFSIRDYDGNRSVVMYKSLHHNKICYDYIVFDEVRSLLTYTTSITTENAPIRTNITIRSLFLRVHAFIILVTLQQVISGWHLSSFPEANGKLSLQC